MSKPIPFHSAGQVGIIKDIAALELVPPAWSNGRNIKFRSGKIFRAPGQERVFGTPLGGPKWLMFAFDPSSAFWMYSDNTKVYATDGANHAEITRAAGVYSVQPNQPFWDGCISSGIPVITNGVDKPQSWSPVALATDLIDLPNWPANTACRIIRPYKSFLIAMNIVKVGVTYPHLIKWSHPASPGAVPSTWDETDPTKLAGERELGDSFPGQILDALTLRDSLMIYKTNTVWGLTHIGGTQIFRTFPILEGVGILAGRCVTSIRENRSHVFASVDDLIVFDGQNTESILDAKFKKFIETNLDLTSSVKAMVIAVPKNKEVWYMFPELSATYPTLALIWNWQENTLTLRDLPPNLTSVALGPLVGGTNDVWDVDTQIWDADASIWDATNFRANFAELVGADPTLGKFLAFDHTQQFEGVNYNAFVEREQLAVTGQDRLTGAYKADQTVRKLINRIWIKASGAPFNVSMGGQESTEEGVVPTYSADSPKVFTPGVTKYLDFEVNTPLIALKFDSISGSEFVIEGFDIELALVGQL